MYAFTDERPVEEEEDLQQSVATIQRLEKQCKTLTEKNTILTKQNQLLKQKLQQIAAAQGSAQGQGSGSAQNQSQHYTIHEHAAVFKDTSSVPSMANLTSGEEDDDQSLFILFVPFYVPLPYTLLSHNHQTHHTFSRQCLLCARLIFLWCRRLRVC